MKKIIRIACLALCLVMLLPAAVGCAQKDSAYGAHINMYLASEVYNFDPAYAYMDISSTKLLGMLFEGLMKIDEDGDLEKAMLKSYKYVEDDHIPEDPNDDTYTMTIELKDSMWSDGRAVHADQYLYAWKRLLDPEFDGEGAELLYDIKGAWERKNEMASPDDIGLTADQKILTIEFNHSIDPEEFLRKTASLCLVPLREDAVEHYYNWSSANTTIVTNGPFTILSYYPGDSMQLARNSYYNRNIEDEDKYVSPTKYVKPYLINIDFQLNAEEMMQQYENGELFYISELPASKEIREQYKERARIIDSLCTHTYYFNTNKAPFDNAVVRQVLGKVIDRNAIVNELVFAKPATGLVPAGITDLTDKDDFAANNQNKLDSAAMSVSEAKSKLSAAGIDPASYGTLYLTVKTDSVSELNDRTGNLELNEEAFDTETVDYLVAKTVVETWNKLGFDFEIKCVGTKQYKESTSAITQYRDMQVEALYGIYGEIKEYVSDSKYNSITAERASFDVIALDYQALSADAFSILSVFNPYYSGSILVGPDEQEVPYGHITGYNNETLNTLINEAHDAYVAGDMTTLSAKLHEVEKILLEEMPVIPIFVYQHASVMRSELSGVKYDYFGGLNFNKVKLKNWQDYLVKEEEE